MPPLRGLGGRCALSARATLHAWKGREEAGTLPQKRVAVPVKERPPGKAEKLERIAMYHNKLVHKS